MTDFSDILIATDLDGTFLGTKAALVQRNLDAVDWFKERGGFFTLATGRMTCNMSRAIPMAADLVNLPIISCNGALLYDLKAKCAIAERPISHTDCRPLLDFIGENYPDCGLRLSCPEGFVTDDINIENSPHLKKDLSLLPETSYVVTPRSTWDSFVWYKFVIRGLPGRLDEMRARIEEKFPGLASYSKSGASFFEVQSIGVDKSVMLPELRRFCEEKTGKAVRIYTCGDYENDIAMLKAADCGVCPANALDCVKDIADLCLCANTEGLIAELIKTIAAQKGTECPF